MKSPHRQIKKNPQNCYNGKLYAIYILCFPGDSNGK